MFRGDVIWKLKTELKFARIKGESLSCQEPRRMLKTYTKLKQPLDLVKLE